MEAVTFYSHVPKRPILYSYVEQPSHTRNATMGNSKLFWSLLSAILLEQTLGF